MIIGCMGSRPETWVNLDGRFYHLFSDEWRYRSCIPCMKDAQIIQSSFPLFVCPPHCTHRFKFYCPIYSKFHLSFHWSSASGPTYSTDLSSDYRKLRPKKLKADDERPASNIRQFPPPYYWGGALWSFLLSRLPDIQHWISCRASLMIVWWVNKSVGPRHGLIDLICRRAPTPCLRRTSSTRHSCDIANMPTLQLLHSK